jgi:hypothetical protein
MRHLEETDYIVDPWHCDLASGVFHLGRTTAMLLGVPAHSCGVIDLMHAYERKDRTTLLDILEQATASSAAFCFTAIACAPASRSAQHFCVGRSVLDASTGESRLQGVFAFQRERAKLCA